MSKKLIDYIINNNVNEYYLKMASDVIFPHINSKECAIKFYENLHNDKYFSISTINNSNKENFVNNKYIDKKYFKCSKGNIVKIKKLVDQLKEEVKKENKIQKSSLIFFIKEAFEPIIIDKKNMSSIKLKDKTWYEIFDSEVISLYPNDDLNFSILMLFLTKLGYDKQSMFEKKVKVLFKDF